MHVTLSVLLPLVLMTARQQKTYLSGLVWSMVLTREFDEWLKRVP